MPTQHCHLRVLQEYEKDLNRVIDNMVSRQNQLADLERKVAHYKVGV
jgi:hypothetical protein